MRIEFDSDDNLPLNKPLKFSKMTIIVRYVFEEDGKFYPQIHLDECFYVLKKCCNTIELMLQKEYTVTKQVHIKRMYVLSLLVF